MSRARVLAWPMLVLVAVLVLGFCTPARAAEPWLEGVMVPR